MAPFILLSPLFLIWTVCVSHAAKNTLPKDMHQDMYCIGCEMTVKVLDRALHSAARDQLETLVPGTLRKVCKPDHFEISEYSKHTMSTACKHIVKNYEKELTAELVSQYRRGKRASYLDLVQRVCLNMVDACHGVVHDHHDHDPLRDDARVTLDPETNEFVVLPGKNLKVARPVSSVHEEL